MAAAEAVPLAKTGGLADVIGALPRVLRAAGADVIVVLPAYRAIDRGKFPLQSTGWSITVPISNRQVTAAVLTTELPGGVRVYLPEAQAYFDRDGLYGTADGDFLDNAERFAFFARAILAIAERAGAPDVLHCHDWQTALAPAFLRFDGARYPALSRVKTILTIHNLGYQGLFWRADWHLLNLDWSHFKPQEIESYGKINYLKAGLVCADALTTVSRKYAEEIQTAELGYGLEGVLQARRGSLTGILNGVDYDEWSPSTDPHIVAPYTPGHLEGKAECKSDLQGSFGLPAQPKQPVIGMVSRLADQKGLDLVAEALPTLLRRKVQLVVLGTGEAKYERLLTDLGQKFRARVGVRIAFDNTTAHKIEAGADVFLMPSRYEPCGLNQIYSLKYGTIPVVRATGGLDDTIVEFDATSGTGTGFKFADYTATALLDCVGRALACYGRPAKWRQLMRNAMACDFSWEHSAQQYLNLYRNLLGR
jgi:starch synthase